MSPAYHVRPGLWSDVPAASDLYKKSFDKEPLLDSMFPGRRVNPAAFHAWITRRFRLRYWTPGYMLTMAIVYDETDEDEEPNDVGNNSDGVEQKQLEKLAKRKGHGRPVGLTWWHRPVESLSFYERWISPSTWLSRVVLGILKLHNYLSPIPTMDPHKVGVYDRVFSQIEPGILNSDRRRGAWYLATLGVDPVLQGGGIGSMLLRDGLAKADSAGVASWLVGLQGLEGYYGRHGFVEVARANVGELKNWQGGSVMFRNE